MSMPIIGSTVHYHSYGTPNGEYLPEPRAAIVTEIGSESTRSVGLAILNPTGLFFNQDVPYADMPKPGHWSYPLHIGDLT